VIGRHWVDAIDAKGNRRLENPKDFVRIEIEAALNQNKRVIPVLVGEAEMPATEELPQSLQPLARRQALRVKHERYRSDADGLIKALKKILDRPEPEIRNTDEWLRQLENVLGQDPPAPAAEEPPVATSAADDAPEEMTVEPPVAARPAISAPPAAAVPATRAPGRKPLPSGRRHRRRGPRARRAGNTRLRCQRDFSLRRSRGFGPGTGYRSASAAASPFWPVRWFSC